MDDDSRRIVGAALTSLVFRQQILEDFSKHFRVNGDLPFKWFRFVYRKVVSVKNVKNTGSSVALVRGLLVGKEFIGQWNVHIHPVVSLKWFKQPPVEERYLAVEPAIEIFATLDCERLIEQGLQNIVEEIGVS